MMHRTSLVAALLLAAGLSQANAQAPNPAGRGADFYKASCAVCHGMDGKGQGPAASYLTVQPSDLTTLTRRNDNMFPFYKVFQMIDGRTTVGPHGTRDMPFWGDMFQFEAGDRFGEFGRETYVRGRIAELVMYLETIQR